jgi:hypothetical protein
MCAENSRAEKRVERTDERGRGDEPAAGERECAARMHRAPRRRVAPDADDAERMEGAGERQQREHPRLDRPPVDCGSGIDRLRRVRVRRRGRQRRSRPQPQPRRARRAPSSPEAHVVP